jgi:hypothetical protein
MSCAGQEGGLKNSGRETHDDTMNQITALRNSDFGLRIADVRMTKAATFAGAYRRVSRLIAQLARIVPAGPALSHVRFFLGRSGTEDASAGQDKIRTITTFIDAYRRIKYFSAMWKSNQTSHGLEHALLSGRRGVTNGSLQVFDFSPVMSILQHFSRFFTPFLSCKRLVSRRLRQNQGLFKSRRFEIETKRPEIGPRKIGSR